MAAVRLQHMARPSQATGLFSFTEHALAALTLSDNYTVAVKC